MVWCLPGDKPLYELMMIKSPTHISCRHEILGCSVEGFNSMLRVWWLNGARTFTDPCPTGVRASALQTTTREWSLHDHDQIKSDFIGLTWSFIFFHGMQQLLLKYSIVPSQDWTHQRTNHWFCSLVSLAKDILIHFGIKQTFNYTGSMWISRHFWTLTHWLPPCLSVWLVCWLYSHHRILMKFSGVINNGQSEVHANGQGPKSKVKDTKVKTQLNRFRTVTPVWIHIWWWNDAQSLMLLRRGVLLFLKVISQTRSHG